MNILPLGTTKLVRVTRHRVLALGLLLVGTALCHAATLFVDASSTSPLAPYTNWATAARDIQSAVEVSVGGDTVLVTNGTYATGGRNLSGTITNRVAIDRAITVQSVNGPEVTIVRGTYASAGTNGDGAVRCVYLSNGATLIGFTLTNGATYIAGSEDGAGGGIWCEGAGAAVSNCTIMGNCAYWGGGGASGGTIKQCRLISNWAQQIFGTGGGGQGGGAYGATLDGCVLTANSAYNGGGAFGCMVLNATITTNSAFNEGGGVHSCIVSNSVLLGNLGVFGGGALTSRLDHCTLVANRAAFPPGIPGEAPGGGADQSALNCCLVVSNTASLGGGVYYGTLNNCTLIGNSATIGGGERNAAATNSIIYFNTGGNYAYDGPPNGRISFCCTTPSPVGGVGDLTNDPAFVNPVNGDFRLRTNSPCINSGVNGYAAPTDLDGNPRIVGGTVDIGAYEFQGTGSSISYAWLQQYGFPTDGSADFADPDGDGMSNYAEWRADTNPTNAQSVFRVVGGPKVSNTIEITWQSVNTRDYTVEWSFGLSPPQFHKLAGSIAGQPGLTSYTQHFMGLPPSSPTYFRISVQPKGGP